MKPIIVGNVGTYRNGKKHGEIGDHSVTGIVSNMTLLIEVFGKDTVITSVAKSVKKTKNKLNKKDKYDVGHKGI